MQAPVNFGKVLLYTLLEYLFQQESHNMNFQ